jgi:hypothetical protein
MTYKSYGTIVGLGALTCLWCARGISAYAEEISRGSAPLSTEAASKATVEALDSRWTYPWYDGESDSLRRIKVSRWDRWWPDWTPGTLQMSWLRIVLWSLVIAALLCVAYLLARVYMNREKESLSNRAHGTDVESDNATRVEDLPFELAPAGGNLLELAQYYYARGDFNRAVIYLYSHQLLELDRRQLLRLAKGKTNRQYLRELVAHRGLRNMLERIMLAFEDAFFGNHDVSRERFEGCWNDCRRFTHLAEGAAECQ